MNDYEAEGRRNASALRWNGAVSCSVGAAKSIAGLRGCLSYCGIGTRNDNLYEAGGGLTWQLAKGWSLNPEILFTQDQSSILAVTYSSTKLWTTLRVDF